MEASRGQDETPQWTVARTESGLEPLCAVYSTAAIAKLRERVARGRFALYPLAEELATTALVDADQSDLFNLNTLKDLERFELDGGRS